MSESHAVTSACEAALTPRLEQKILPGLDRIRHALTELGHPERRFPAVLVLGTNGKGSTAALLASLLGRHGVRTGLYTSPHLVRVEERIAVAGGEIAPSRLLTLINKLVRFPALSYFETLTAAALLHFAEEGVGVAVLEAGLGGRWDATNAGEPAVSLLTNVGTDHQAWLGTTRAAIATEKAAALRGREAIVGDWDAEVEAAIRAAADPATPLSLASHWASVQPAPAASTSSHEPGATNHVVSFSVAGVEGSATLPLAGPHQLANLRLALAAAAALARHGLAPALRAEALAEGITAARWRGRLQWHDWQGRRLLLDGAHNAEAAQALAQAVAALGLAGRVDLLFSCLDDKPLAAMAALLHPLVRRVTVAPLQSPRATPIDALATAFPGCTVAPGVGAALAALQPGSVTLVAGSLRLVGEVLRATGVEDT